MTRSEGYMRGIRLNDLDRALVYRIGYRGRRWEILGPDDSSDVPFGLASDGGDGERAEGPRTAPLPAPLHTTPADSPD